MAAAEAPSRFARLTAPAKRLVWVAFLDDFAVACMALGVQFLAIDLHARESMLGLLPTASATAYTAMCLVAGPLSDRWGRRRPAMLSCLITGIVWLLMMRATSPWQLLALMPLSGGALSLLWPSMQAWLAEFCGDNRRRLNRTISMFNLSWSGGIMLGTLAAGFLWVRGHSLPFLIPAGLSFLSLLVLAFTPPGQQRDEPAAVVESKVSPERAQLFMWLAWIGNFASWYCRGTIGSMFPKLGDTLGFSEPLVSALVFVPSLALCLMFGLSRLSSRWQYHLRVLLAAEALGIAGMAIVASTNLPSVFTIGFILTGLCTGVTYVSSLTYALQGSHANRGKRSGLHEAVLGLGIIVGPLLSGFIAERTNLHTPFATSAAVFVVAMALQGVVWLKLSGRLSSGSASTESRA